MKKSTILGILTAAALVTTSAATYAAWDKLEETATQNITVRDRVNLDATASVFTGGELEKTNDEINYTGTYTFTAKKLDKVTTLKLTPNVKGNDGQALQASQYDIVIKDNGTALSATDGVYTDESVVDGANTYTVELKIKDTALAGQKIIVSISGELS